MLLQDAPQRVFPPEAAPRPPLLHVEPAPARLPLRRLPDRSPVQPLPARKLVLPRGPAQQGLDLSQLQRAQSLQEKRQQLLQQLQVQPPVQQVKLPPPQQPLAQLRQQPGTAIPSWQRMPGNRRPQNREEWLARTDQLLVEWEDALLSKDAFDELADECGLLQEWRPQVSMLAKLGLTRRDFRKLDARVYSQKIPTIQRKLKYLREDVGLTDEQLRRLIVKHPRILEYRADSTLAPRLALLQACGVQEADLAKVVMRAPNLMGLSLKETLEPRIAFLKQSLGVNEEGLGKMIARQPQLLTYSTDFMQERIDFLLSSGLPIDAVAKAVIAHPQVLQYRPEAMRDRLDYLRGIGMSPAQVTVVVARLPQMLALDIAANLAPKFQYLVTELGGTVSTVATYPGYFSLSLQDRIKPRNRYLQAVRPATYPRPFPMNYLKCSDLRFATSVARTTPAQFEAFQRHLADSQQLAAGSLLLQRS